ncbi:MAG: hypothetical protein U0165_03500 [Polyangiaceae bacterium]
MNAPPIVAANPDATSFHDRDRNELRRIIARASAALDAMVEVGDSLRELHVINESSQLDGSSDGRARAVDALFSTFSAIAEIRAISHIAGDILADHEVKP